MSAAIALVRKDLLEFMRDRRLIGASALVALLALIALLLALAQVRVYEQQRQQAERLDRATWLAQGERSPHGAAHFSAWAFRPLTALALLEPGITPYSGSAIWMEAHYRDPAAARPAEDRTGTLDLGTLSLAWVIQVLAPLLVGLLAAGLIARERERGTLWLMLASGAPPQALVRMKARALAVLLAMIIAPLLLVAAIAVVLAPAPFDADTAQRLVLWLLAHGVYLAIAIALAVTLSASARSVDRALLLWVGGWALAVLIAPRVGATMADALAPLPSAHQFWSDVQKRLGQADVFDPESPATKALEAKTLAQYRVSRLEDLPVNFAGIQLDAAERHGDAISDRAYGDLHTTEDRQRALMRVAALLSPLPPLQNISAGLAGTDSAHQRAFAAQAERHRRLTVGMLNRDMIQNAGRADYDYKAGPALWAATPEFVFRPPSWTAKAREWAIDAGLLLAWLIAALWLLRRGGRALGGQRA